MPSKKFKRTLVTTALPYANGALHLGHCAGTFIPADIFVRYKRLCREEIIHIGGSDEHGAAITIAAEKAGVSPQSLVDKYHQMHKDALQKLGIASDHFSRNIEPDSSSDHAGIFLRHGAQRHLRQKSGKAVL